MNVTVQTVLPTPFRAAGALSCPEARRFRPALSQGPAEAADHSKQSSFAKAPEDEAKLIQDADVRQSSAGAENSAILLRQGSGGQGKQAKLIQDKVLNQLLRSKQASKQAS
ncbi:MAG: hypothetical protein IJT50_03705, partial [Lentisphaeria bacterium]|nr:hypothetical protein [Lentisphaeria bacterium]